MNTRKESNKNAKKWQNECFSKPFEILNSNGTITPKMLINCVQTREKKTVGK